MDCRCQRFQGTHGSLFEEDERHFLSSLCLIPIGLKFVKLVDAEFVWTEPHSKRIKIKITIQKEVWIEFVVNHLSLKQVFRVILQQSFIVVFIFQNKTCEDCIMEVIEHKVKAVVQLRQKVWMIHPLDNVSIGWAQENVLFLRTIDSEEQYSS